jgi:hypothetical protein
MSFYIQVSNPTFLNPEESYDDSFKEVIEAIFPYEAEYAFLSWNGLPIPLRYKYDIGMIFNEVLSLLDFLLSSEEDLDFSITLSCFAFTSLWHIKTVENSCLSITSEWSRVESKYEQWLNNNNYIEIKRNVFIAEWKALLQKIIEAIKQSSLSVDRKSLHKLNKIENAILEFGKIYKNFPLSDNQNVFKVIEN